MMIIMMLMMMMMMMMMRSVDPQSVGDGSCTNTMNTANNNQDEQLQLKPTTKLRLGLEWFVNPDHLPLIVAQQHGIFQDFGLDVELVVPQDHWEAEQEILAGRLDIAVTEPLHLAQDAALGKPVLGFLRFFHTDGGVMYDQNEQGSGSISRPRDMCGKTISYPGSPGPGGPAIVQTMVQADGKMDCPLDSYQKYNGGFFHTDAIASGNANLATLIFWNFEIPEATSRGLNVSFFSLKDWGVPDFCQLVLMTTPERYQQLKGPLRQLTLALKRATGIIHQQPALAKQYYLEYIHTTTTTGDDAADNKEDPNKDDPSTTMINAILQATLPAFPNDYTMASEYYDRLMKWLVDTNQVDKEQASQVDISSYWTNEMAW
jgi:putative hydroxymethylpyrimidine transport system substrate-binding protein